MIRWPIDFLEFLKLLNRNEVRYLIVGGYAVGVHGYIRVTSDLDVFVDMTGGNADALVRVFQQFGFDDTDIDRELFLTPGTIVRAGGPALRVEIFNEISGVQFEECFAESIQELVDGVPVRFIGLRQLLINKQASGRRKDRIDYDHLSGPQRLISGTKESQSRRASKKKPKS